jgi:hypothetical protein
MALLEDFAQDVAFLKAVNALAFALMQISKEDKRQI